MIKRGNKKDLHTKPVKGKAKAKPRLVAKTKARQRKRVHRVARGKPKPGHIRRELGKHYAKADHVQWWREQIKERGRLEAVYREVRKRQREYRDRDVG
jgi:hypothetical protein